MARHRLSRRFKDAAQLVLGFALPAVLVLVFVFSLQRRASTSRNDASKALYSSIFNAVLSRISITNEFRLVPLVDLQYLKVAGRPSYTGWYKVGPDVHRVWFQVTVLKEHPLLKLSDIEFFDRKPQVRF